MTGPAARVQRFDQLIVAQCSQCPGLYRARLSAVLLGRSDTGGSACCILAVESACIGDRVQGLPLSSSTHVEAGLPLYHVRPVECPGLYRARLSAVLLGRSDTGGSACCILAVESACIGDRVQGLPLSSSTHVEAGLPLYHVRPVECCAIIAMPWFVSVAAVCSVALLKPHLRIDVLYFSTGE